MRLRSRGEPNSSAPHVNGKLRRRQSRVVRFLWLRLKSSSALAAENLFLRKHLEMYVERRQKPRRATDSARFVQAQLMSFSIGLRL
jgi:hypothetical protein